jgi:hypothetical protein
VRSISLILQFSELSIHSLSHTFVPFTSETVDEQGFPITGRPVSMTGPFPALAPSSSSLSSASNMYGKVTKEFREHQSMCYGADWLVQRHPKHKDSYFEAAASCSFYDKAAYIWDSVF